MCFLWPKKGVKKGQKGFEMYTQKTIIRVLLPQTGNEADHCRKENKMLKQLWDYVFLVR